ncbi:iron-containing alcohol dehydrogenase [Siminovitchia fortis]|uniref:Iron-containing alcohol dehydrogenase n=1 Tax=Siminovitchia fortis TaxID=254758 RepID=A0A443IU10_9BACI|nr:iron-containing alcohol dehydrogenase [Siminovitchia fortis]RWR11189.1 iron-containing alcohol dehydrogenase [Siminovitchia fortis]WHY80396.1 iron-containing alcohol dehydrogenase [Siminovitchia fortis]
MNSFFTLRTPPSITYGPDSFLKIGEQAAQKGKNALIISDKVMEHLGNVEKCKIFLKNCEVDSTVYLGVETEPTDHYVAEALKIFRANGCDLIISLGGGSCIDTAKAVSVLAANDGNIDEFVGGKRLAKLPPIPHIAIPTTAGTGSEATDVTVITNTSNQVKMMIKQPAFMPAAAIVDPGLSKSSPKHVTAATGVDALSHAIEAYLSKKSHPMTDMLALSAVELIVNNIRDAYTDGSNMVSREKMALGSLKAGMAFTNASVCLVHGMSRPIGALFHVPHGFSNAMLLPAVLEFSRDSCIERLADLGRIFRPDGELSDEEAADIAVESVKGLYSDLNIPNLKGWGIDEKEFYLAVEKMAKDAMDSGSPANNPRVPTLQELQELYMTCYDYQFSGRGAAAK